MPLFNLNEKKISTKSYAVCRPYQFKIKISLGTDKVELYFFHSLNRELSHGTNNSICQKIDLCLIHPGFSQIAVDEAINVTVF